MEVGLMDYIFPQWAGGTCSLSAPVELMGTAIMILNPGPLQSIIMAPNMAYRFLSMACSSIKKDKLIAL